MYKIIHTFNKKNLKNKLGPLIGAFEEIEGLPEGDMWSPREPKKKSTWFKIVPSRAFWAYLEADLRACESSIREPFVRIIICVRMKERRGVAEFSAFSWHLLHVVDVEVAAEHHR